MFTVVTAASSQAQLPQLAGHDDLMEPYEQELTHDMLGLIRSAHVVSAPFTLKPVPPEESWHTPFTQTRDANDAVLSWTPVDLTFWSAPPAVERKLVADSGSRAC